MTTLDDVRSALATVTDPDLKRDVVSLGMIRDLVVDDGCVRFRLVLTTSACPMRRQLEDQCRSAVAALEGVRTVELTMDAEVPQGRKRSEMLPGVRHVIAVGSGKGGVGKSTVTVNLACALQVAGARVGIMDADIHGPSIPLMMGINHQPSIAGTKLLPLVNHEVRLISMGFLMDARQAVIWRGPMLSSALKQFAEDVAWGELDYLLIDLPPGTGDVQISISQTMPLAGVVIVSTPQAVALADARRCVTMFRKVEVPIFGLCENMATFVCPGCGHEEAIFGHGGAEAEAAALDIPFLGRIPLEPGVRVQGDAGTPVVLSHPQSRSSVAFRDLAERVAQQASIAAIRGEAPPAAG